MIDRQLHCPLVNASPDWIRLHMGSCQDYKQVRTTTNNQQLSTNSWTWWTWWIDALSMISSDLWFTPSTGIIAGRAHTVVKAIRHAELVKLDPSLDDRAHCKTLDNSMQHFTHDELRQAHKTVLYCCIVKVLYPWRSPWWAKCCIELSSVFTVCSIVNKFRKSWSFNKITSQNLIPFTPPSSNAFIQHLQCLMRTWNLGQKKLFPYSSSFWLTRAHVLLAVCILFLQTVFVINTWLVLV